MNSEEGISRPGAKSRYRAGLPGQALQRRDPIPPLPYMVSTDLSGGRDSPSRSWTAKAEVRSRLRRPHSRESDPVIDLCSDSDVSFHECPVMAEDSDCCIVD